MPRIPEANFNTVPSERVPKRHPIKVDTGNASQRLRQMGGHFTGMADKMDATNDRIESLTKAQTISQEYEKNLLPVLDLLSDNAQNGFMIDSQGKQIKGKDGKPKTMVAAAQEHINAFQSKALLGIGDDSVAMDAYGIGIADQLQTKFESIQTAQVKQQKDFASDGLDKRGAAVLTDMTAGNGDAHTVARYFKEIELQAPIIGNKLAKEKRDKFVLDYGMSYNKILENKGISKEAMAQANDAIDFLPPSQRETARIDLEEKRQDIARTMQKERKNHIDKSIEAINEEGFPALVRLGGTMNEMEESLADSSLSEFESPVDRAENVAKVFGTKAFYAAMGSIATRAESGVLSPDAKAEAKFDRENFRQEFMKHYEEIRRGLASSTMAEEVDMSLIDQEIGKFAQLQFHAFETQSTTNPVGAFKKFNPEVAQALRSGNPIKIQRAKAQIDAFANKSGLKQHERSYVDADVAVSEGKFFKNIRGGDQDPLGELGFNKLKEMTAGHGDGALKVINDYVTQGGGTAMGETHVPSSLTVVGRVNDEREAQRIVADMNLYDDNVETIAARNPDLVTSQGSFTTKFRQAFAPMYDDVIGQLDQGGNHQVSQGLHDAIRFRTADIMANNKDFSMSQAIQLAAQEIKFEMPVVQTTRGAVTLNKNKLIKNPVDMHDLEHGLRQMEDLVDVDVDFDGMYEMFAGHKWEDRDNPNRRITNPRETRMMDAVMREEDPQLRKSLFLSRFGGSIRASNDPDNNGVAKLTIAPKVGMQIPIIVKDSKGVRRNAKYDVIDYFNSWKAKERRIQETTGGPENLMSDLRKLRGPRLENLMRRQREEQERTRGN